MQFGKVVEKAHLKSRKAKTTRRNNDVKSSSFESLPRGVHLEKSND
jgi:hypothetical protein